MRPNPLQLAFFLLFTSALAYAEEVNLSITAQDRILVIAPHPDDEALGAAGVLQQAQQAGAAVRVIYLTNGELNEVSSIFYQKRPLLLKSDFIKSGHLRKDEAVDAMTSLGFSSDNLIFFGYPDGGLLNIWFKYWGNVKPFRSFFTRINTVPYKDNFSYKNPYQGDAIIRDMERVLIDFEPTRVLVTAPFDLNHDHQAAYLYAQVALFNLEGILKQTPKVFLYIVHAHQWPQSKKYLPNQAMTIPDHIDWAGQVRWQLVSLKPQETEKKQAAILRYKSQIAYKKNFLLSFARANEAFADYPPEKIIALPVAPKELSVMDVPESGDVRYGVYSDELWVDIPMKAALDEMGVLSAYIFSYRKGFLFSEMPKFSFKLFGNKLFAYEGFQNYHDSSLVYRVDRDRVTIRIPLKLLKNPDILFVSARNAKEDMSLDFGTWRTLEIVKGSGGAESHLL